MTVKKVTHSTAGVYSKERPDDHMKNVVNRYREISLSTFDITDRTASQ